MKELTIIGAGPIGLFAGYYAGLRSLDTTILECDKVGGQLTNQYPESYILDVPGHVKIKAIDLVNQLKEQLETTLSNSLRYEGSSNLSITYNIEDKNFVIHTENKLRDPDIRTKSILLATGAGYSSPKKYRLSIDGNYLKNVIDCKFINYERDVLFENTNLLILGGGNTAIDYCIDHLDRNCNMSIVNRSKLKGNESNIEKLKEFSKRVKIYENSVIINCNQTTAIIQNLLSGAKSVFNFNYVGNFLGNNLINTIDFIKLEIDKKGDYYIIDDKSQTNVPLLYAAGDCAYSEFGMKLLVCGFAQATIAVNHCKSVLSKEGMFGGYTSIEK